MRTVGIRELKTHLSQVLREVQGGETVLVTDRGRVIAELRQPGLSAAPLSPVDQKLAELAAKGILRLAEKPKWDYEPSPVHVPPGTAAELLAEDRDDR
ncbi:MAG: type II toxin-antitoxin system prevent-host-death family antitoxin [Gemmatimonadaceae bacterium]|nr:type II toxin-antitoxin system prevent-host-death family antitoxin [Gemmatimonadaceae bacterium]